MDRFFQEDHSHRPALGQGMRRARFMLIAAAVILLIGMAVYSPMALTGAKTTALIKIPKNATEKQVNDSLKKYLGSKFTKRTMYLLNTRHTDYKSRYGAYEITEGMSPFAAARKLGTRGQTPVNITINGFRSMHLLTQRVASKLDMNAMDLYKAATDSATLAKYGLKPQQALALFLDDTYEVYWNSTPEEVVKKVGDHYKSFWENGRSKKAERLGLKPVEALTICSIVDEETLAKSEKGKIGRLYLNRLHAGMKLQADPTVRFALKDYTIKRVMEKHLLFDSPYNTYKYAGLPPGPIRTTGKATVDALLSSAPSSDLYMCAKEDFSGTHNFAATYEEHVQNALKYQHALDQRGIK